MLVVPSELHYKPPSHFLYNMLWHHSSLDNFDYELALCLMLDFMHSLYLIASTKGSLPFLFFLSRLFKWWMREWERFMSKMPPYIYLHHFTFKKELKSIVGKLDTDIPTMSSDRKVLKFLSNPHLSYILPLSPLVYHTQPGIINVSLFILNIMLISVLVTWNKY